MNLPEFMFMSNKTELPSVELIQQTKPPFVTAQVYFFKSIGEEAMFFTNDKQGIYANITGYRVYIVWKGTLTGKIKLNTEAIRYIQDTILKMVQYYEKNRIYTSPERFNRYRAGN